MDQFQLEALTLDFSGFWSHMAEDNFLHCQVTGLPMIKIFWFLAKAGIEPQDYVEIEFLGTCDLEAVQIDNYDETNFALPEKAIAYFRNKAEELSKLLDKSCNHKRTNKLMNSESESKKLKLPVNGYKNIESMPQRQSVRL